LPIRNLYVGDGYSHGHNDRNGYDDDDGNDDGNDDDDGNVNRPVTFCAS
jgi:hypothetical protein